MAVAGFRKNANRFTLIALISECRCWFNKVPNDCKDNVKTPGWSPAFQWGADLEATAEGTRRASRSRFKRSPTSSGAAPIRARRGRERRRQASVPAETLSDAASDTSPAALQGKLSRPRVQPWPRLTFWPFNRLQDQTRRGLIVLMWRFNLEPFVFLKLPSESHTLLKIPAPR